MILSRVNNKNLNREYCFNNIPIQSNHIDFQSIIHNISFHFFRTTIKIKQHKFPNIKKVNIYFKVIFDRYMLHKLESQKSKRQV